MVAKKYDSEELRKLYINENKTAQEMANNYGVARSSIKSALKRYGIKKDAIPREAFEKDGTLEKLLSKHNISKKELELILKNKQKEAPSRYRLKNLDLTDNHVKFTVISDLHMGHKNYRPDILEHAIVNSKKQGSEFFLIPGDLLEGMSGRDGHLYELELLGATNQLNYGIEQLSQIRVPIYAITATNSHDGWFSSKGNMGFETGPEMDRRIPNFEFLGYDEADIKLGNGITVRMSHPGDGTAYAISYKMQKYINALSGGTKPDVIFQGHYHKAMYMFYRNIHGFEAGTLEDQTIFMKKKGTPSHTGYWIVDLWANKKGVDRIKPEFVPFFE